MPPGGSAACWFFFGCRTADQANTESLAGEAATGPAPDAVGRPAPPGGAVPRPAADHAVAVEGTLASLRAEIGKRAHRTATVARVRVCFIDIPAPFIDVAVHPDEAERVCLLRGIAPSHRLIDRVDLSACVCRIPTHLLERLLAVAIPILGLRASPAGIFPLNLTRQTGTKARALRGKPAGEPVAPFGGVEPRHLSDRQPVVTGLAAWRLVPRFAVRSVFMLIDKPAHDRPILPLGDDVRAEPEVFRQFDLMDWLRITASPPLSHPKPASLGRDRAKAHLERRLFPRRRKLDHELASVALRPARLPVASHAIRSSPLPGFVAPVPLCRGDSLHPRSERDPSLPAAARPNRWSISPATATLWRALAEGRSSRRFWGQVERKIGSRFQRGPRQQEVEPGH